MKNIIETIDCEIMLYWATPFTNQVADKYGEIPTNSVEFGCQSTTSRQQAIN